MHDARRALRRDRLRQAPCQLVQLLRLAVRRPDRLELVAEAPHLPLEVSLRLPEPFQPDLRRHERVQPHEHIDELLADLPPLSLVEPPLDLIRIDGNEPIHILHDVKRRVVHGGILAQRDRLRRRESRRRKRRQYPKLAPHIVRRRLHVRKRRPPQHPRLPVARKPVRYVRPPVPDHAPRQRIDRLDLVPKPRQHALEIETGRAIAHSESLQRRPKCRSGS